MPLSPSASPRANLSILAAAALALVGCTPSGRPGRSSDAPAGTDPSLELLVLPDDDGAGALVGAIAAARRRVWMEMYLLTDDRAIGALAAARSTGAEVRVLLEPSPYGEESANEAAFATLARAGIDVRWFQVPSGLVHAKAILVDDTAWISTANLTNAGLGRNRELIAVDTEPADVRRLEDVWQADAVGWPAPASSGAPAGAENGGSRGPPARVVVSPDDARTRLTALVNGAVSEIILEVEEIFDADFVGGLIAARARGVHVSVVVPAGGDRSGATSAAATRLTSAGVAVTATGGPTLHAKTMTVDGRVAYLGSVNFTRASFDDNREVGLLLEDRTLVTRVRATIDHDASLGTPLP